jgi:hypothetical protein
MITKTTLIVDEMNRPLDRVHLSWGYGGTTTNFSGIATVKAMPNQRVTISYVGKEPDYYTLKDLPKKIILMNRLESLDEVVVNAKPKKTTPKYLFPALGATALLAILMSMAGNDAPKKITL